MLKFNVILLLLLGAVYCNVNAREDDSRYYGVSLPYENWTLLVNFKGCDFQRNDVSPDEKSRSILATNKDEGVTISAFIEKQKSEGNHIECRKYYWEKASKSPLPKENLSLYEKSDMAFVEHDTKEFKDKKIDYHSMNVYMSVHGYWVDIHISKVGYQEKDKQLFEEIVNSVKVIEPKPLIREELFIFASSAFYNKNYESAIKQYESVLKPDTAGISIDTTIWYVTVDNLGMSYGLKGDYKGAKRVFEYGIKLEPNYPNFYYSLACTYAEMSDLDNTLKNLEITYLKKDKKIKIEKMPNAAKDPSFKKYQDNEKFQALLTKYGIKE